MLKQNEVHEGYEIDEELAALLEPFRGLDFPLSPKYFLEDYEFYVAPRYLTSSLTKQDLDNLCNEAERNLAKEDYTKAAKLFKEVCYYNHHEVLGWAGLGNCYQHIQKFDQARIPYAIAGSIRVAENFKNSESTINNLLLQHITI
jgi:Flp pilus assembly protein TadD